MLKADISRELSQQPQQLMCSQHLLEELKACDAKDGYCPLPRPLCCHFYALIYGVKLKDMF